MHLKIGILGLLLFPFFAFGEVQITEIMYDLSGADDGREWVEILNAGTESVDLTDWKFFDVSNHVLNAPPKNGGVGSLVLPAGSYAILADDASTFLKERNVSVSVIDTVMSLGQQKDKTYTLKLLNANGTAVSEMSYSISLGANGDGNSLQSISGVWKPAAPTPGIMNANEVNAPPSSSSSNENSSASSSPNEVATPAPSGNTNPASEPVPSLLVKVSAPTGVTVGADATFSATVFGVKKEPIPNARVVWSFGNGAVKEGLSVRYGYNIPGSYIVIADASSGGFAGSARMTVAARKPDVRVSGVLSGANGFVEIENRSNAELDVSGWGIASNNSLFTIPDRTIILPSAKVAFSAEVTKLLVSENDARLLYPNGTLAAEYVVPALTTTNIPRLPTGDTPFKGGTPNIPPLREVPKAEDVSVATNAPAAIALSVADDTSVPLWQWLLGITGVCAIGIGALAAFRFKHISEDKRSDVEKLVAEIKIDTV